MTQFARRSVLTAAGAAALAACSPKAPVAAITSATAGDTTTSGAPVVDPGGPPAGEIHVGALADVPVGGGKLTTVGGIDLIVTQPTAGEPAVFVNMCTHARCKIAVDGAQLVCPCHGSTFDLNGAVLQGPATDALKAARLRVDSGQIIVESV